MVAIKSDIDRLLYNWDEANVKKSFSHALQATLAKDFSPTP
jgi:hypothetical protein